MLTKLGRHGDAVRWFYAVRVATPSDRAIFHSSAGGRINLANALHRMGRSDRARPHIETVMAIAERMQSPALLMHAYSTFVMIETQLDRLPSARAALEALKETAATHGASVHQHRAQLQDAILLVREGDVVRALEAFATLSADVRSDSQPDHLLARAEAHLAVGQPEEALEWIARLVDPLDPGREALAKSLRGAAQVAIGRRELEHARRALDTKAIIAPWIRGRVLLSTASAKGSTRRA